MKISIRRAIATLGLCAFSSTLMAAEYQYSQPTRLPSVSQAGYYSSQDRSPYKTASADVEHAPGTSDIVIQGEQYGSSPAMAAPATSCTSGCTSYDVGGHNHRSWGSRVIGMGQGCGTCCSPWFASASGLYFTRDDANEVWLSYDTANIASRVLGTRAASMDWSSGAQVSVGRYFNCNMNAVQVTYWGIYSNTQTASVFGADQVGNLDSSVNYNSVGYDNGGGGGTSAVNGWFDDAQVHRLRRDYNFQNVEVNLLGSACAIPLNGTCATGCGSSLQMSWLAGLRFFRFDEDFQFATDDTNTTFTGEVDEVYHNIDVQNNLVGFQLGANANYVCSSRLSLLSGIKFGIYGNYMENHQSIIGGTGTYATIDNVASPYDGLDYNFRGDKTNVSFLGEVDLGLRYQATSNWSIKGGYRALAISGVALSINQFPGNFNFEDAVGAGDVETNGSMILHGGYLGATYNY